MTYLFCYILFFTLASFTLHAQGSNPDSLIVALPRQTDSLEKLKMMHQIAHTLKYDDPEAAFGYARSELELARSMGNHEFEIKALGQISHLFFQIEDYPRALEYALEMERSCLSHQDKKQLGNALNAIANVYFMQDDWEKAREYYQSSLELWREQGQADALAGALNNVAKTLIREEKPEEAENHLREALQINRIGENLRRGALNLLSLGKLEIGRKRWDQASDYLEEGLVISDTNGFTDLSPAFLNQIARAELGAGHVWRARNTLLEVLSDEMKPNLEDRIQACEQLAGLFEGVQHYRNAFRYLRQASELRDSLNRQAEQHRIANIRIAARLRTADRIAGLESEQEARDAENSLREAELRRYIYLMGLLAVLALVAGLLVAFMVHRRNKHRLSRLVDERTRGLEQSHSALNAFIYRSSHEIRGTITSIQGLYHLLEGSPADQREVIPFLGKKIRQLEKCQRNLILSLELSDSSPNWETVDMKELIRNVIADIESQHGGGNVNFRTELPNQALWKTDAVLIRTILDNLLDNSVTFRTTKRQPWCRLRLRMDRERMELLVEDNGKGLSPEIAERAFEMFSRGDHPSTGSGLGLYVAKMAVEKMGGTIRMESKPDPGAIFVVELPARHEKKPSPIKLNARE